MVYTLLTLSPALATTLVELIGAATAAEKTSFISENITSTLGIKSLTFSAHLIIYKINGINNRIENYMMTKVTM